MLRKQGADVAEPEIIATTGWTTADLGQALDEVRPRGPYALVSLLIGVNNQFQGLSSHQYRAQFGWLLARAITLAGGRAARVLVLSIPDWGITPFATGRDRRAIAIAIDAFNDINRDGAHHAGARYVDVTAISRAAGTDPSLTATDGLHPSARMYRMWAELALPTALAALQTHDDPPAPAAS